MARYTGPRQKLARRYKEPLFGPSKALERKAYGPGQHGRGRRSKPSDFAVQLMEKQKAKIIYGVLERQFRITFVKAANRKGNTGELMLQLLEARLDNAVYRMGFAPTRRAARQLVSHKHIRVNGQVVNIASYSLQPGDVVSVRERSKGMDLITETIGGRPNRFNWLDVNKSELKATFLHYPERTDIPENINERLIVELYSR